MKIAEVKRLATTYTHAQIEDAVSAFEIERRNPLEVTGENDGEKMSHLLAASFVRKQMDKGLDLNLAVREYSKRVRAILS